MCVDAVYSSVAAYSSFSVWMAVITYSLQIYYDFSGYSDMAIGIGKMLGFDLGENFNLPYLAKRPSEFWKRWHISLSSWFRDYVYIPLGGNRKGKIRTYLNLFFTMLLSGLWHGGSWAFIIWGTLHALASVLNKMYSDVIIRFRGNNDGDNKIAGFVSVAINFFWVTILWIPFRTNDVSESLYIIKKLFAGANGITYIYDYSIIFAILLLVVEIYAVIKNKGNYPVKALNLGTFWNKVILICFVIIAFVFSYVGNTAFIYSQF